MTELHLKHRPATIEEIVGQPGAVAVMRKWGTKPPHTIMFHGPSGCGKTTAAYALMNSLGVTLENNNLELVNCADKTGIDNARKIIVNMDYVGFGKPVKGKAQARGWVWDECHQLSTEAQHTLLTKMEAMPPHAYFVFCTTHPHKTIPTLRGRCTQIEMKPVPNADLKVLIDRVAKLERPKVPLTTKVRDTIAEKANGCAREVLVELGKVLPLADEKTRLNALSSLQAEKQAIDLCRLLMKKPTWAECAKLLKQITEPEESIRRAVLGYANAILLNGRKDKMVLAVIEMFRDDWYSCGRVGLTAACCELSQ